nr:unnamed protein product [Callosobruchus chinensis]CAH7765370.1 unnamed protein product [Callosobruchus chinensis]
MHANQKVPWSSRTSKMVKNYLEMDKNSESLQNTQITVASTTKKTDTTMNELETSALKQQRQHLPAVEANTIESTDQWGWKYSHNMCCPVVKFFMQ